MADTNRVRVTVSDKRIVQDLKTVFGLDELECMTFIIESFLKTNKKEIDEKISTYFERLKR